MPITPHSKPVIGVTLDSEEAGGYADYPWYALRQNYMTSLAELGAVPLALPHHGELADEFLTLCDGIIVTGGAFDVPPELFNEQQSSSQVRLKPARTAFESAIVKGAMVRDMPLLGICGGEQLLAVLTGGTLIQHIPDALPEALEHSTTVDTENAGGKKRARHPIEILENTRLSKLVSARNYEVNSSHHQAVKTLGAGCRVNAVSPDGVIEGIECEDYYFCMGVQWHPEYLQHQHDRELLKAFVEAADDYKNARRSSGKAMAKILNQSRGE
ncbi:gamma-glutamyl-gamma-aminobutyrate hydrolase family protein [Rouxiella badensis]|jgi:putative glutamine amidotransferase|uniref:Gamma-glutamyl-gamma-aminobutyrate hydrolase n=1 Tax=Rouxiella badensis TaxID=1646377 RepID=A0A1X0WF06_9GAMM|nr:gamma-glutamyl-gamma-aminobutyrate hydrolase family protein [Rouxiella badensis]MCC3703802.1 gamma-glutamyl-gamma-aminobutyrate hydrolase family protein [Rouxiella badensis]MCC3719830.1 gamma-glutamyl-gamma-aminobutyrate hydrolase family protein [Rouxiella badensis]MCC3729318.1 gamma-glutamyl-gamma-aminobutyrate hydrolase family protein [Rouxiella badensis]MCC3734734.1 gamma-glutamyl-gamma-aminobutyrate hydrolase family protein [Rouxiella badensis]MCC3741485.1 gamma-glutamyl-gamma-aminobuty